MAFEDGKNGEPAPELVLESSDSDPETEAYANTNRVVVSDSWFASVKCSMAMKKELNIFFFGVVKTNTSKFPMTALDRCPREKGSWVTYSHTDEGTGARVLAVAHRKGLGQLNKFVSTCFTTDRGNNMVYRYTEAGQSGAFTPSGRLRALPIAGPTLSPPLTRTTSRGRRSSPWRSASAPRPGRCACRRHAWACSLLTSSTAVPKTSTTTASFGRCSRAWACRSSTGAVLISAPCRPRTAAAHPRACDHLLHRARVRVREHQALAPLLHATCR